MSILAGFDKIYMNSKKKTIPPKKKINFKSRLKLLTEKFETFCYSLFEQFKKDLLGIAGFFITMAGLYYAIQANHLAESSIKAVINENKLVTESDLFALEDIHDEITTERIKSWLPVLKLPDDINILYDLKSSLRKAFTNKVFQQDTSVRRNWIRFYRIIQGSIQNSDGYKIVYYPDKNNIGVEQTKEERVKELEKNVTNINEYYNTFNNSMYESFIRLRVDFELLKQLQVYNIELYYHHEL